MGPLKSMEQGANSRNCQPRELQPGLQKVFPGTRTLGAGRDRYEERQPEGFTVALGASCSFPEAEEREGLAVPAGPSVWKPGSGALERPRLPGLHRDASHGWDSQTREPRLCSHALLPEPRLMTSVRTWASTEPSWAGLWRPWAVIWHTAGGDCTRPAAAWLVFLTPGSRAVTRCLLSEVIGH